MVEVVHGPLRGVVGRLMRKDAPKARLVLSVDLIGQAVSRRSRRRGRQTLLAAIDAIKKSLARISATLVFLWADFRMARGVTLQTFSEKAHS